MSECAVGPSNVHRWVMDEWSPPTDDLKAPATITCSKCHVSKSSEQFSPSMFLVAMTRAGLENPAISKELLLAVFDLLDMQEQGA